jgi:2-polyprenyl-3-methyl-5-hydroxy-6-metoxy-1,4-benzoquinol methylase
MPPEACVSVTVSTLGRRTTDTDEAEYWERRLETLDLSTVGWQGLGLSYNRWVYRLRRAVFERIVGRLGINWNGKQVLDVGSGTGFYLSEWLRLGADVTGSDLTRASVDALSTAFPETKFVQWDVSDPPPYAQDSFDAVSAMDVMFHIVDDSRYHAALQNISQLLKEGGYFVWSDFLIHGPVSRSMHQVIRPLHEVEEQLAACGLEVTLRRPMFVLMNTPVDSTSRVLQLQWRTLQDVVSRFPWVGGPAGATLYPLEYALVSLCREGPSTEIIVCRKR